MEWTGQWDHSTRRIPGSLSVAVGPSPAVFILDDDPQLRSTLSEWLVTAGYEVRAFGSPQDFLSESHSDAPGCLLLDIRMPGLSGLDLQRAIARLSSQRPIVVLSGHADVQTCVDVMKAGAVNFLTKPFDRERLLLAIEEALSIDAAERSARLSRRSAEQSLATLSPRERQVLEHIVCGRLNKQIAADLGTVEKTIKVHRARVMRKMRTRSLAGLVQLASQAGITAASARQP